jgi:hypothetical protein
MKASVFSKMIGGLIALFACSLTLSAVTPKDYMYDTKEENGKIISKTIFVQKNGLLDKQLKYDFTYNEDGKVTEKKACRWNGSQDLWEPFYQISYQYAEDGGHIRSVYSMWNKKTKDYSLNTQTIVLTEDRYEEIFQ